MVIPKIACAGTAVNALNIPVPIPLPTTYNMFSTAANPSEM